ncbi:hypothetical protein E2C01_036603 [Portunus trituberculatus]|uniref:Uncharacterized protein n=1 Tax=Portunus trituberculatus TaxID=210409 RepID=A0A5B7FCX5_PORTR|nr:hypothetical protein [Portunus trituberculatus]
MYRLATATMLSSGLVFPPFFPSGLCRRKDDRQERASSFVCRLAVGLTLTFSARLPTEPSRAEGELCFQYFIQSPSTIVYVCMYVCLLFVSLYDAMTTNY